MFAFQAAADPAQTKCYYFFTKPSDGSLVCEPTYAQIVADEQKDGLN
jgi:cell division protein YceG involved in septum cleavage